MKSRWSVRLVLAVVVCLVLTARLAIGQSKYWEWSDPTPAHHSAVRVMVKETTDPMGIRKYGNGIYIEYGKLKGILTVKHLMRRAKVIRIFTQDGEKSEYCVSSFTDRDGHDLAFIPYSNDTITPLKIASTGPVVGQRYEMISLRGNNVDESSDVRPFYLNCTSTSKLIGIDSYGSYCISGDSGSAIVNDKDGVVGIQASGNSERPVAIIQGYHVNKGCLAAKHSLMVAFLNRLQTQETQSY